MCGKPCDNSADMQTDQRAESHIVGVSPEPVLELDIATLNAWKVPYIPYIVTEICILLQ